MKKSEIIALTGGLSNPSKMPGKVFSIPAKYCLTGSKLRKLPGTVCSKCYACKDRYVFPNVQRALQTRYWLLMDTLTAGPGSVAWRLWLEAMRSLIGTDAWFRFHDSGDLQSADHLKLYCELAAAMPSTRFWLPTKEHTIVREYREPVPANLTIRLSAVLIDGSAVSRWGIPQSVVWSPPRIAAGAAGPWAHGHVLCPAAQQGNTCGDCRACWDPSVPVIIYPRH